MLKKMNKKKKEGLSWSDLYIYPTVISCVIIIIGIVGDKCTQSTNNKHIITNLIPLEKEDTLHNTKHIR
jgi:hypothetical protein